MKEIAHKGRVAQNHAIHGGNGRRAGYEVVITWGTETRRPAAGMALLFNPYMAADTSRPVASSDVTSRRLTRDDFFCPSTRSDSVAVGYSAHDNDGGGGGEGLDAHTIREC